MIHTFLYRYMFDMVVLLTQILLWISPSVIRRLWCIFNPFILIVTSCFMLPVTWADGRKLLFFGGLGAWGYLKLFKTVSRLWKVKGSVPWTYVYSQKRIQPPLRFKPMTDGSEGKYLIYWASKQLKESCNFLTVSKCHNEKCQLPIETEIQQGKD